MKYAIYIYSLALFVLVACGGPKVIVSHNTTAQQAYASGNYTEALVSWKLYLTDTPLEEISGKDFELAALTAYKAGEPGQAAQWFDQARYKNHSSIPMYKALAEIYHNDNNLSKELNALELLTSDLNDPSMDVKVRLYDIYVEINETEKAVSIWEKMDEASKGTPERLESYFEIQKDKENKDACDALAVLLLEKDANNHNALDWQAKKYYWLGEKHYQKELASYEANKTSKQYKILLQELDKATADLKTALTYLDKLWVNHKTKEYASYLASIYGRFGDEKKVAYYKGFM